MALIYVLWGAGIGFLVAAPIGPVNVICIRRTIAFGPSSGFIVGLGAAVADTVYGSVAAFGLSSVTALLVKTNGWFEVIGGLIMLVIGVDVWRSHPHMSDAKETPRSLFKAALTTFVLTISNPLTILGFLALFAGLGLSDIGDDPLNSIYLIAGVMLGSTLWWFTLTRFAVVLKRKLSDDHLLLINRFCAVIVFVFGIVAIGKWLCDLMGITLPL